MQTIHTKAIPTLKLIPPIKQLCSFTSKNQAKGTQSERQGRAVESAQTNHANGTFKTPQFISPKFSYGNQVSSSSQASRLLLQLMKKKIRQLQRMNNLFIQAGFLNRWHGLFSGFAYFSVDYRHSIEMSFQMARFMWNESM